MSLVAIPLPRRSIRCHYRPILLATAAMMLVSVFWFASRYPQLLGKARHVGQSVASMAYRCELVRVAADAPAWQRILASAVNWLDGMKVEMLVLIPWQALLAEPSVGKMGLVSLLSVLMPVPIALDVMFAAELQQQGVALGYVMIFAMTLGSWSLIPSIDLWRDVSRRLSVILFAFFVILGWSLGLIF